MKFDFLYIIFKCVKFDFGCYYIDFCLVNWLFINFVKDFYIFFQFWLMFLNEKELNKEEFLI